MSEQYRDPYQRTPINGMFYKNLHGDDALSQPPASVTPVETVADESSVPVVEESSAPATDESSSVADEPTVEPTVEPVTPPAEVPVLPTAA